jgi:CheY-like chemotaxis protein
MPPRILIVEDDKLLGNQIREMMEFQGFEAEVASTGPDGITAFEERPADLVIVAVMLPGVHGIRVLEAIRKSPEGADVPAFLMSAVYRTAKMFAPDMERLGVVDFLAKPFSLNDLALRVEKLLLGEDPGVDPVFDAPPADEQPPSPAQLEEDLRGVSWGHPPGDSFLPVDTGRHLPSGGKLTPDRYMQAITTLFHSHSSGRLHLTTSTGDRIIYFLNGYPVWVDVATETAGLAHWLVDEQILLDGDLEKVQQMVAARGWSTRKALLDLRLVSPGDLPPLVEGWVAAEVQKAIEATGRFDFEPSDDFATRIPVYEVNPIRVIWEGVRTRIPKEVAEEALDAWDGSWLGKTSTFARLYGYLTNSGMPDLPEFLGTQRRSLRELRSRYSDPTGTVSLCLWLMITSGLLGLTTAPTTVPAPTAKIGPPDPPKPRRPSPQLQTRRYGPAAVEALRRAGPSRPAPPSDTVEDAIIKDYLTKIDEDHYTFLGVSRLATSAEIEAAYNTLAGRYRTAGSNIQGDARRKAKELLAHLVNTFEELRNPHRRTQYDEQLRRRMLGLETPSDPYLDVAEISGFDIPSVSEIWEGTAFTSADTVSADRLFNDGSAYPPVMSEDRLDELAARLPPIHGATWVQARRHMHAGDWRRAYLLLDELRGQVADDPTILADLGWTRFVLADGDYDSIQIALEWAGLAITFAPRHLGGTEVKARILCDSASGSTSEEQMNALERLLRLSPGLPWAELQLSKRRRTPAPEPGDRTGGLRGIFRRKK